MKYKRGIKEDRYERVKYVMDKSKSDQMKTLRLPRLHFDEHDKSFHKEYSQNQIKLNFNRTS